MPGPLLELSSVLTSQSSPFLVMYTAYSTVQSKLDMRNDPGSLKTLNPIGSQGLPFTEGVFDVLNISGPNDRTGHQGAPDIES